MEDHGVSRSSTPVLRMVYFCVLHVQWCDFAILQWQGHDASAMPPNPCRMNDVSRGLVGVEGRGRLTFAFAASQARRALERVCLTACLGNCTLPTNRACPSASMLLVSV